MKFTSLLCSGSLIYLLALLDGLVDSNGFEIQPHRALRYAGQIWSEDAKTYHKKLYSELNPMEGKIKEDRNPGGRMG
jgi:hypothetical protein